MAFTMTDVNYAAEYSRALANAYPYLSYFPEIWASRTSQLYKPGIGKTMYIPSITTSGARPVASRDGITGAFSRNWNNSYQPVTLQMDREWDTVVDPMDMDETNAAATIANITRSFTEQQKVPEMVAYAASKLYSFADSAHIDTTTLNVNNIATRWETWLAAMQNMRVPRDRIVAYMTPQTFGWLKMATGINRNLDVSGDGDKVANRYMSRLDGVTIHLVPEDMMKTAYVFTEGWAVASGAKQINAILVDPECVAATVKYETSMMSAPTAQSKGKYLYYERYYYDVFKLTGRPGGIYIAAAA